jgi:hypothetical protein
MTLELKEDGYVQLERDIQKIENMAWDNVATAYDMKDLVQGYMRVIQEVRKLRQTLRDTVLMVPDPHPAAAGDKGAAA